MCVRWQVCRGVCKMAGGHYLCVTRIPAYKEVVGEDSSDDGNGDDEDGDDDVVNESEVWC